MLLKEIERGCDFCDPYIATTLVAGHDQGNAQDVLALGVAKEQ